MESGQLLTRTWSTVSRHWSGTTSTKQCPTPCPTSRLGPPGATGPRLTSSCPAAASTGPDGEPNRATPTDPCKRVSSWPDACVKPWPTSRPS
eukprot:14302596-Heterocapsa_arctica.AAC.1